MTRLTAAGLLPERAGQPVKIWAHISLADLLRLEGSSALQQEWTAQVRARWAGGCNQPASACEVHHTKHKKNGGPTSATDCVLLCTFHHQIAI